MRLRVSFVQAFAYNTDACGLNWVEFIQDQTLHVEIKVWRLRCAKLEVGDATRYETEAAITYHRYPD